MITPELLKAYRFFRSDDTIPALQAIRLAKAEAWGAARNIRVTWEYDQESHEDIFGEPLPKGCEMLCAYVKHDGRVLGALGGVVLKYPSFTYGVVRDPYIRFVEADLLEEARVELEQQEAAEAAAKKLAKQKDDAYEFMCSIALSFQDPDEDVNGGDLVEAVADFLRRSGLLDEVRVEVADTCDECEQRHFGECED